MAEGECRNHWHQSKQSAHLGNKGSVFTRVTVYIELFDGASLSSGPASPHAPWEWWPGNIGWEVVCHRRSLERYGGGLWGGSGGLQPSIQHLGSGGLPAKTLVLQRGLHHLPWPITLAWAFPHWFNITLSGQGRAQGQRVHRDMLLSYFCSLQNKWNVNHGCHCALE